MERTDKMRYIIACLTETDGDVMLVTSSNMDGIRYMIKTLQLGPNDYALIKGEIIKSLANENFDIKNYKG